MVVFTLSKFKIDESTFYHGRIFLVKINYFFNQIDIAVNIIKIDCNPYIRNVIRYFMNLENIISFFFLRC